jgi:hypothetical protein
LKEVLPMLKRLTFYMVFIFFVDLALAQFELLPNGDFMDGLSGWEVHNPSSLVVNVVSDPFQSAHFQSSSYNQSQPPALRHPLTINPFIEYKLRFYVNVAQGGIGVVVPRATAMSTSGNCVVLQWGDPQMCIIWANGDGWYEINFLSLSPATITTSLYFVPKPNSSVYLSDVSLLSRGNSAPPTPLPPPLTPMPYPTYPVPTPSIPGGVHGICVGDNCTDYSDRLTGLCVTGDCGAISMSLPNLPYLPPPTSIAMSRGDEGELTDIIGAGINDGTVNISLTNMEGQEVADDIFDDLETNTPMLVGYLKGFLQATSSFGTIQPLFNMFVLLLITSLFFFVIESGLTMLSSVVGLALKTFRFLRMLWPF